MQVLDTTKDRMLFNESLVGKRVLHVKGFGTGFSAPNESQIAQEEEQAEEAIKAITAFNPDYIVVDGDPWGDGFQRYIKKFINHRRLRCSDVPQLVWAKNVIGLNRDGEVLNMTERSEKIRQAEKWAAQDLTVTVIWLDDAEIHTKMDSLFGAGTRAKLQSLDYNTRGGVRILNDSPQTWVDGLDPTLMKAITALENRCDSRYFEKCSFENSAKGNAIFDSLHNPGCAAHGVLSFGGGESVLLEYGTMYLNSKSGFNQCNAAILPFNRGRPVTDPKLPRHVGAAFSGQLKGPIDPTRCEIRGRSGADPKLPKHVGAASSKQLKGPIDPTRCGIRCPRWYTVIAAVVAVYAISYALRRGA